MLGICRFHVVLCTRMGPVNPLSTMRMVRCGVAFPETHGDSTRGGAVPVMPRPLG